MKFTKWRFFVPERKSGSQRRNQLLEEVRARTSFLEAGAGWQEEGTVFIERREGVAVNQRSVNDVNVFASYLVFQRYSICEVQLNSDF